MAAFDFLGLFTSISLAGPGVQEDMGFVPLQQSLQSILSFLI